METIPVGSLGVGVVGVPAEPPRPLPRPRPRPRPLPRPPEGEPGLWGVVALLKAFTSVSCSLLKIVFELQNVILF